MRKIQNILSLTLTKVSNRALSNVAMFLLALGATAVTRSVVPLWHNEPEMPESMLNEINEV